MNKKTRKFRGDRLYKLIKTIAHIASAGLFLVGGLRIYAYEWGPSSFANYMKMADDICGKLKDINPGCGADFIIWHQGELGLSYKLFGLGILIPFLFIIGEKIYNYVYPKKE